MGGESYPSVQDPDARTAIDYGLYGVPETFFIAPDGQIARKITGPASPVAVRQIVDSLLTTVTTAGSP
jgi:cytochrome c biogenesis protein CcmG/thiol:disulfide interchange protein DsbE